MSSFIDGPVKWSIGTGNYVYPVGKNTGNYFPFTLSTSSSSSPVITVEAFDSDAGAGATFEHLTMSSISHTEYWRADRNSGTFTGKVSLTRIAPLTVENLIGKSPAQGGTYASIGGTASSPSIINSNDINSLSYFVMGRLSYISITNIAGSPFCAGSAVGVPFEYAPADIFDGSTFTAQLSNSSGSFSPPVTLGTILSDLSGSQTINTTIPVSTAEGTGYRIRVVSNSPAITGSDNGSDIIVNAVVTVPEAGPDQSQCNNGSFTLAGNTPTVGAGTWTLRSGTASITNALLPHSGVTGVLNGIPALLRWTIVNGTCSSYDEVRLKNNTIPTITGTTPDSRCGTGTVTLGATALAGTIHWYAASTGGLSLGTGTSFTTPALSSTTTYWVDATDGDCTTGTRSSVTATVNTIPTITDTTPDSRCGTGTVTLGATASAGTIHWYAASTGGSSLGTGTSFTTPSLSSTTTYWVDATDGDCTTGTRSSVTATVNTIPTITGTTPDSRCGTGTVTLGATASAGTIHWYAASTGGSSLGTGTSFTTPSLSSTTTYWVDATDGDCTTGTRSSVTATVNTIPTITDTTPDSRCGTGTVTLGATASAGTIHWYAASTGGLSLGTGTSVIKPGYQQNFSHRKLGLSYLSS